MIMSDSDSNSDTANLPSAQECEDRCQKFAAVTGTDSALAMFYLQDTAWELEVALNAYFADNGGGAVPRTSPAVKDENQSSGASKDIDPEPHRIRLLSWNIDGLDSGNYKSRTTAVCEIINKESPHVVFLQEVIPATVSLLEERCPLYWVTAGGDDSYFTAIMLRVGSTECQDVTTTPFYTSKMMRNLLTVTCSVKGVKMHLMTSHLESTKNHSEERKRQLSTAFKQMKEAPGESTVVFGGDLNLRDNEVAAVGGIPDGILDLWEVTGKRPDAKFTWDAQKNDNTDLGGNFKPRCRFDRLYLRHCKPAARIKPVYFELAGIERLPCLRFPSDHWAILAHFDINGLRP